MDLPQDQNEGADSTSDSSDTKTAERRDLMRKLAVGAFAVPVVLAALTSTPAAAVS